MNRPHYGYSRSNSRYASSSGKNNYRHHQPFSPHDTTLQGLARTAAAMDGRNYGSYKSLKGRYQGEGFELSLHRVQSDPYAPPSACSITVPIEQTGITCDLLDCYDKVIAVCDFIARRFHATITTINAGRWLSIAQCGQEIMERSYSTIHDGHLEVRFQVSMPARGRRIMGREAQRIFAELIPQLVMGRRGACRFEPGSNALSQLREHVNTYCDWLELNRIRARHNWVAFISDGSILARSSGISDKPMTDALAFSAPDSMRTTVELPSGEILTGMPIPAGVTLIVGGGYHGKSTLLRALERSVYAHIPGDGRERVVCDPLAAKIRSEDGRAVTKVDISTFIQNVPTGADTTCFSTANASGSTSQAASIAEVLEAGASTLLIDEDTCATNMMIRDERMRCLVTSEPITPFVDRVRSFFIDEGVSTILVMGGSGDYLDVADRVLMLDNYQIYDVTDQAQQVCLKMPRGQKHTTSGSGVKAHGKSEPDKCGESSCLQDSYDARDNSVWPSRDSDDNAVRKIQKSEEGGNAALHGKTRQCKHTHSNTYAWLNNVTSRSDSTVSNKLGRPMTHVTPGAPRTGRVPFPSLLVRQRMLMPGAIPGESGRQKTKAHGLDGFSLNRNDVDLSAVEQIVDRGQTEAIAWAVRYMCTELADSRQPWDIFTVLDNVIDLIDAHGLDALSDMPHPAFLVRPRRLDIACALNRLRTLRVDSMSCISVSTS
ncbi:MAG: ABC-ATPase domain-containing protein [Actinomycetaceae bacterium]|nr:ABC-ATPase domain-containing protein [Actinomycetaceae bacterium]